MFNTAVEWQILKESPVSRVKPPKVTKKEVPAYDEEQTAAMLAALEQEPLKYQVLIHLALASGLRKSEIMALTWDDVDFQAGTIEVTKTRQYASHVGVHERETTKNESSNRLVSLPLATMNMLSIYKAEQETWKRRSGLVARSNRLFTTDLGGDMFLILQPNGFLSLLKNIVSQT